MCAAPTSRSGRPSSSRTAPECTASRGWTRRSKEPSSTTLVDAGYDVWLENWRGSIHAGPNPWTMDQAAVHDHPAAVRAIVDDTGADDIKAVIQCIGSTSFTMSALAGLLPQVSTIVANSVSLHVVVPPTARRKALYLRPIINPAAPYWDPSWGEHPTTPLARGMSLFVRATHRECKNEVCRMASFIYGAGRPTLWQHENLNGETHDWLSGQFGPAPRQFFDQIARCIKAGHLVSVDGLPELPEDFVAQPPQTDARFVLLAGERNRCFLPVGQRRTFDFLESHGRGRHSLHMIPGYGHLDVFIGRNAHRDTYPLILRGLEIGVRQGAARVRRRMPLPPPAEDSLCLVTGASSGTGAELARRLAARGHAVAIVARRRERLDALADELRNAHGARVDVRPCDLADTAARAQLVSDIKADGRFVVGLCNDAGLGTYGRFQRLDPEREREQVRVNVDAPCSTSSPRSSQTWCPAGREPSSTSAPWPASSRCPATSRTPPRRRS